MYDYRICNVDSIVVCDEDRSVARTVEAVIKCQVFKVDCTSMRRGSQRSENRRKVHSFEHFASRIVEVQVQTSRTAEAVIRFRYSRWTAQVCDEDRSEARTVEKCIALNTLHRGS